MERLRQDVVKCGMKRMVESEVEDKVEQWKDELSDFHYERVQCGHDESGHHWFCQLHD